VKVRERIIQQFPSLSPTLQAAARHIVDHPNEVVVRSMRALAEQAGAQPATFVRLAQQLGFEGWADLRSSFVSDLGLHDSGYGQRAKSLAQRGSRDELVQEMNEALRTNLDNSFLKSAALLPKAADALRKARAIHIAGYRASAAVAYSLFYGFRLFRHNVHLLDGGSGGLEWQLRAIGKGDAVCAISFAPYSRETELVLEAARAAGATRIVLTDSPASPLALAADLAVFFDAQSPSFFPSVAAAIAMTESLLELVVAAEGTTVADHIAKAESTLHESGAYLAESRKRS